MKTQTKHRKVTSNGPYVRSANLDKSVRMEMTRTLWNKLSAIADAEGRVQGRPKSVSAVMRRVLQAFVEGEK